MNPDKASPKDPSDISRLQTYYLSGSKETLTALTSLERLLDEVGMTADELEEMCREDTDL